jgi:GNAT superfamily N-acetyltransferase
MVPRLARAQWTALGKDGRRAAFGAIVEAGPPPGLLAYAGELPVGWVAVGPRSSVDHFNTAKVSRPLEAEAGVYAITCFFVRPGYRKRGLTSALAAAAIDFARAQGASAIEACAIDSERPLVWGEGFVGIASVLERLGFTEIARRSPRRPLMRLDVAREAT